MLGIACRGPTTLAPPPTPVCHVASRESPRRFRFNSTCTLSQGSWTCESSSMAEWKHSGGAPPPVGERVLHRARKVLAADDDLGAECVAVGQQRPHDLPRTLVAAEVLDQGLVLEALAHLAALAVFRPVVHLASVGRAGVGRPARAGDRYAPGAEL